MAKSLSLKFLAPLFALAAGCVSTESVIWNDFFPPEEKPCQIFSTWKPEIVFAPDPAQQGRKSPFLAGQLYLFGPKVGTPLLCKGELHIELYEEGTGPDGQPKLLEIWNIDPATLNMFKGQDIIGWTYQLGLPLEHYRPEGLRGHMKVCFTPVNGTPLYFEGAPIPFHSAEGAPPVPVVTTKTKSVPVPVSVSAPPNASVRTEGVADKAIAIPPR
jgi:hypothetical protein